MILNMALEQKKKNENDAKRLKALAKKMLNSLSVLREKKLRFGKAESDAEIVFIDKLIGEFESDLQRKR